MNLLQALLKNESGGRNIPNVHEGTSSGQAQGFFQITTGTWNDFGGRKYAANPLGATYEQQAEIASKIPLKRWDESTVALMRATGRPIDPNKTLGENLAMNGEGFGNSPAGGPADTVSGRYDPRRDTPTTGNPTGAEISQYALRHPVGPEGDDVTMSPYNVEGSPYNLPKGTTDDPLIVKAQEKNPFEKVGAAVAKMGDQKARSTLGPIQNVPNPAPTVLPPMPTVDPASSNNARNALVAALMRVNSGQLWPMGGMGGGIG